jgi:hypothetical protein
MGSITSNRARPPGAEMLAPNTEPPQRHEAAGALERCTKITEEGELGTSCHREPR